MSKDRRKHLRHEVDYFCWLRATDAAELLRRRVRNISAGGAKVACTAADELPNTIEMYMTQDGRVGRRCKVVWRSEDAIGLMFLPRSRVAPPQGWKSLGLGR